jgi:hypothetical protein
MFIPRSVDRSVFAIFTSGRRRITPQTEWIAQYGRGVEIQ